MITDGARGHRLIDISTTHEELGYIYFSVLTLALIVLVPDYCL